MAGDTGGTGIDTTVPHSARIWNYWLGGKDNYAVDRMAGDQTIAVLPGIVDIARASRGFLARVVRYLAAGAGIRQGVRDMDEYCGVTDGTDGEGEARGAGRCGKRGGARPTHPTGRPTGRSGTGSGHRGRGYVLTT